MIAERRLIYEVFVLLKTHRKNTRRINFKKTYVTSIRKLIKTELRRTVLEDAIHKSPLTSANNILTSLNLVLNNAPTNGVDPSEELDVAELAEVNAMVEFEGTGSMRKWQIRLLKMILVLPATTKMIGYQTLLIS